MMPNQANKLLNIGIVIVVLICAWFFLLRFIGYGSLHVDVPDNVTVKINGHAVNESDVKLRSGTYDVVLTSAAYELKSDQVNVGLFRQTDYKPTLQRRNPLSILTSAIGTYGLYGKPDFTQVQWLDDDRWVAGIVGPGSTSYIALHYQSGRWQVAYFDGGNEYPHDLGALPQDVQAYLSNIGAGQNG